MDAPLSLICPLCCEEKFSSHHSLKYHILSIIDNLLCPACNIRFDDILNLVDHLGRECREIETDTISTETIKKEASVEPSSSLIPRDEDVGEHIEVTPEVGLLDTEKNKSAIDEDEESVMYMCVMCEVHFTCIDEHLQKFHDGEEVVLETEETENEEYELESDSADRSEREIREAPINENDFDEEQCVDKDGRAFTRKVVRIGKFWDVENSRCPMTEKYILENGQVRKVTEEEAEQIEDKNLLIQIHQCPKCSLQFPQLNHFLKHVCDTTKINHKLKCEHCPLSFPNYQLLQGHMKSHLVNENGEPVTKVVTLTPHTCDICKTIFPSFKSLRLHQRMHVPVKSKAPDAPVSYSSTGVEDDTIGVVRQMFVCSICNNTYDKEYEEVHMKSHEEESNFDCTICNRKFHSKENLEMHAKAHTNTKKFTCSYCKRPFSTDTALEEHVTSFCQQRQYECQYCGRRFSRPHEKVKHERIHTGEKPHVCQICGKAFRVSYCLTLHLRTHSGSRPYQCDHCGKRFKSHSVYNHHLLTHSNVRAYKCPFCPKAFKTSVQLAGHKNCHTKPFPCTECNRPFASLYAVRAHMETHKRENNLKFDCWLCGATYARAFALRDHMKNQHADEMSNNTPNDPSYVETQESTSQIENEMVVEDGGQIQSEDNV